jgi:uncharacterized protein
MRGCAERREAASHIASFVSCAKERRYPSTKIVMIEASEASDVIARAIAWAKTRSDVVALVLVGSHARGAATATSDIDLVVVAENATVLLDDPSWTSALGILIEGSIEREYYGLVQSLRVTYPKAIEVEWGITDRRWLSTNPVDPPTATVVQAGAKVLYDPHGLAQAFIDHAGQ